MSSLRVLARLRELGMPCSTLTTRYFRDLFQDIQVIVPRKRIQFRKLVDGVEVPSGRLPLFLLATRVAGGCNVFDLRNFLSFLFWIYFTGRTAHPLRAHHFAPGFGRYSEAYSSIPLSTLVRLLD